MSSYRLEYPDRELGSQVVVFVPPSSEAMGLKSGLTHVLSFVDLNLSLRVFLWVPVLQFSPLKKLTVMPKSEPSND